MTNSRVFALCLAACGILGCTKPNPASCSDGSCTDPALPFCDVDGALSGQPKTCIAVECSPNEFAVCRGALAITCNQDGNNYDAIHCDRGCDDAALGCRECDPGQTVCANGRVQTCDANGAVVSTEACPLGCFADQPRCRDIDPSNGLATYLDMVPVPSDLDLSAGGGIDVDAGVAYSAGTSIPLQTYLVPAPSGGSAIRVIVAKRVRLGDVSVSENSRMGGPALAIIATDDITVEGTLTLEGTGSLATAGCKGGQGNEHQRTTVSPPSHLSAGSGGGAHSTDGARGGGIDTQLPGGAKGTAAGTKSLVPLRGGCPAGGVDDDNGEYTPLGGLGGGAIQLSSRTAVTVTGTINADGGSGYAEQGGSSWVIYGGGGGGGILIEAPQVVIGNAGRLLTRGGAGGSLCASPSSYCAAGGAGATVDAPAAAGGDSAFSSAANMQFAGGGGGGGLGRIRINTQAGTYTKSSSSVEEGDESIGTIGSR